MNHPKTDQSDIDYNKRFSECYKQNQIQFVQKSGSWMYPICKRVNDKCCAATCRKVPVDEPCAR